MTFYFPKDNILFTDGITVPSEKEEFIKRNNNPIIKSYKELSTLINVDDIIEIANRTYLINNDVYTTSTIIGTPYALAKIINLKHPESLSRKALKSESEYFTKKLKPQDSKNEATFDKKPAKYNINGMEFNYLTEIAQHFNINVEQLRVRVYKQNMSIQEAINHKPKKIKRKRKNHKIITQDGEVFSSVYEISKKYDLAQVTVERLLENNESIKNYKKNNKHNSHEITIDGITYKSFTECCNAHNINVETAYSRLKRGYSLEDTFRKKVKKQSSLNKNINKKPTTKRKPILINGKSYPNIKAACKDLNIKYNTYKTRRKKGWTLEDALTKPLIKY